MAGGLLFLDSFGHYAIGDITGKWTSTEGSCSIVSGVNTGSTKGFRGTARKTITPLKSSMRMGCRQKINGIKTLMGFDTDYNVNIYLGVLPDGRLSIRTQGGGFSYDQSAWGLTFGAEYFIELYSTMVVSEPVTNTFSVAWTWEVKVNGVVRWSGSNSTGPAGFPVGITNISQLYWSQAVLVSDDSMNGWAGDVWLADSESIGDVRIVPLFPRANGTTVEWTPSGTSSNWVNVSEHDPDDDTSYNYTSTATKTDMYYMDTIGTFTGTIKGAQGVWRVENADAGSTQFVGVYVNGSSSIALTTETWAPSAGNYIYFLDPNRYNPFSGTATGTNYTAAEIDASQVGIKKTV